MNQHEFYKSKEWTDLLQQLKLERVNSEGKLICEHCGKEIVKAYDCIGHHKIPLNDANIDDYNISLNPDNIALIHFRCHNEVHNRFGFALPQKVYIVYGAPCSGKSTWVENSATEDDIIVDIDRIWECVSFCDKYHKPKRLQSNVFEIRNTLLEQVKMRLGKWQNAFIVGTYPLKMERQRLADKLGAELVFIDSSKEMCLNRAENAEWKRIIEDWFYKYQP